MMVQLWRFHFFEVAPNKSIKKAMLQLTFPIKNWLEPIKNQPIEYFYVFSSLQIINCMLQLEFSVVID